MSVIRFSHSFQSLRFLLPLGSADIGCQNGLDITDHTVKVFRILVQFL